MWRETWSACACALAMTLAGAEARAEDPGRHEVEESFGLRMMGGLESSGTPTWGVGVTAERALWHHGAELELAVSAIHHEGSLALDEELLLKVPAHVGALQPFVGFGALWRQGWSHQRLEGSAGIVLAAGAIVWEPHDWGVCVELDLVTPLWSSAPGALTGTGVEGFVGVQRRFGAH